jgi:hypothetical protein
LLDEHLDVNSKQRRRAKPLINFDAPMHCKFPISQPSIFDRLKMYNKRRSLQSSRQAVRLRSNRSSDHPASGKRVLADCPLERILGNQNGLHGLISISASRFAWTGTEAIWAARSP